MPVLRTVKNIVKNHTDAEVKVREATSNDPWGPSSTLMAEIADLTYNVVAFTEIMQMIWKRLNDHGKNWRHVYKALTLLEYIIKTGSEKVTQQCKENIFAIQTLKDFQHIEDNKDLGANVREKAKALVALLKDDERLKNERAKALKAKERFAENFGIGSDQSQTQLGRGRPRQHTTEQRSLRPDYEEARPHSAGEEEMQLQLALAMSKEEAENDAKKRTNDELKLQMALEESKKEEQSESLKRQQQQSNSSLLDFAGGASDGADAWGTSGGFGGSSNDPWSPPQPQTQQPSFNNSSPFSPVASSAPSSDPWASVSGSASASAPSASNPWDSGIQTTTVTAPSNNDPWSSTVPTSSSQSSPWDTPVSNGKSHKPASLDDDFDILGSRSAASPQPLLSTGMPKSHSHNDSLFSMGLMGDSLPPTQTMQQSKKPEDFLDPKAKGLVNLDSLVTKPKNPAGQVNPFAMTSQGTGITPSSGSMNPFLAQQQARPSLNQMSNSTGFTSQPQPMMNPMMPMNVGYNAGYPPMQSMYPQQPAQSNNPFL